MAMVVVWKLIKGSAEVTMEAVEVVAEVVASEWLVTAMDGPWF